MIILQCCIQRYVVTDQKSLLSNPDVMKSMTINISIKFAKSVLTCIKIIHDSSRYNENWIKYALHLVRAKQGWVPFANPLSNREIQMNISYNLCLNKIPWVSNNLGFYKEMRFLFDDSTMESLTQDLTLAKNFNKHSTNSQITIWLKESVDFVSIRVLLHFVDNLEKEIILNTDQVKWKKLIENSKSLEE